MKPVLEAAAEVQAVCEAHSRYAHELNLPGLRFWPLARYPHLVF